MTDLAQLIDLLETESEGGRELDREIMLLVGDAREVDHCTFYGPDERVWYFGEYEHETDQPPLPYLTSSLDAIVALIARKLPGWSWGVSGALSPTCTGLLYEPAPTATGYRTKRRADGKTPPLALCIAFLRALQAQQETSEDE